jgi:Spy/CpxP family protein refolding chaperone
MKKMILSFCLMAAVALSANAQTGTAQDQDARKEHHHGDKKDKLGKYKALNLTDDQKQQALAIYKDAGSQKEAIRNNTSLTESQKQEQLKQLKKDNEKKFEALLTADQKEKLKQQRKEHKGKKAA